MAEEVAYPAASLPSPLSIVWGRFPYAEAPGVPAVDFHPCLVMGWSEYKPGLFSVLVVFGTSQVDKHDRGVNLVVSKYTVLQQAGLWKETLFDLGRWKWLTWTDRWFESPDPARWPTPVIGAIPADGAHVLRYILRQRDAAGLPNPPRVKANPDI